MVAFPNLIRVSLGELFGTQALPDVYFQGAHVAGDARVVSKLGALYNFFNNGLPVADHLSGDHVSNGVLLPGSVRINTARAGAVLGVATHLGDNVQEFDRLLFDADARPGTSSKFLNVLRDIAQTGTAQDGRTTLTQSEARVAYKNFLDFVKIQFLELQVFNII